jgi:hypothetical protein
VYDGCGVNEGGGVGVFVSVGTVVDVPVTLTSAVGVLVGV